MKKGGNVINVWKERGVRKKEISPADDWRKAKKRRLSHSPGVTSRFLLLL